MGFWNKDDLSTDTTQSSSDKDASPAGLVASTPNALASTGNSMAKPAAAESAKSGEPKDFDSMVIERFGPSLRSALGPGTVIRGKLSFDTPVRIDGKLSGEITSTSAVIVGPQGVLDAKIDVESCQTPKLWRQHH